MPGRLRWRVGDHHEIAVRTNRHAPRPLSPPAVASKTVLMQSDRDNRRLMAQAMPFKNWSTAWPFSSPEIWNEIPEEIYTAGEIQG
jgi:hypothetical protein